MGKSSPSSCRGGSVTDGPLRILQVSAIYTGSGAERRRGVCSSSMGRMRAACGGGYKKVNVSFGF
jgi:hypothetical protein